MSNRMFPCRRAKRGAIAVVACALMATGPVAAQNPAPQQAAPIDLTGYWVALITEDWRTRMLTAPRGDYYAIPLNDEGRRVADQWDVEKDIAEGKQCMSYGAAGIMRVPGRLHITWANDNTLQIETDAGEQKRMFAFGPPPAGSTAPSMQGTSTAEWVTPQSIREYTSKIPAQDSNTPGFPGNTPQGERPRDTRNLGGMMKVVTTHMTPGHLRNNGVPYSANAVLTEYYVIHSRKGEDYLVVTQVVEDPTYLAVPWVTTNHFRREPDGSKWDPRPCELIRPTE